MAPLTFVESSASPVALPERDRVLRCPSCCARVGLASAQVVPGDWSVLHRCGDHVIEAAARIPGAPSAWRWRSLQAG